MLAPMRTLRPALALLVVLVPGVTACGGGDAPADTGPRFDAPPSEESWTIPDAYLGMDAPDLPDGHVEEELVFFPDTGMDAPAADDAPATMDATLACAPGSAVETRLAGVCDGRGMLGCQMWTDGLAGGRTSFARCVPPDGFCARADACSGADRDSCTCGDGPRCADDELCVAQPSGPPRCECITP